MTEYSPQPNNGPSPVGLGTAATEYPAMPKRGPYMKTPKPMPPKWRRTEIKRWRLYRGMTQEKLAELTGLSPGQISDLELGAVGYSPESLQAIADALKTPRGKLLDERPPERAS